MTSLTIIGAGAMGRGIATRALAGGHDVTLIDRDPDKASQLADDLADTGPGRASAGDSPDGDIIVLALPYGVAADIAADYGDKLAGKTVVDITNPIDLENFSGLATPPGTSAAEETAAAAHPDAKVVKAFNTTFAPTLVDGQVNDQPLDVLIAGDDEDAKQLLANVVTDGGLRPIDVGPLDRARHLEALGFLHISLQGPRDTGFATAIKILD